MNLKLDKYAHFIRNPSFTKDFQQCLEWSSTFRKPRTVTSGWNKQTCSSNASVVKKKMRHKFMPRSSMISHPDVIISVGWGDGLLDYHTQKSWYKKCSSKSFGQPKRNFLKAECGNQFCCETIRNSQYLAGILWVADWLVPFPCLGEDGWSTISESRYLAVWWSWWSFHRFVSASFSKFSMNLLNLLYLLTLLLLFIEQESVKSPFRTNSEVRWGVCSTTSFEVMANHQIKTLAFEVHNASKTFSYPDLKPFFTSNGSDWGWH